jgi:serine/threonine protein kinase
MPHDERASDVWSLGVSLLIRCTRRCADDQITLYEILIGRTPFEENEEEEFQDPDTYLIYYERSRRGDWLGNWSMPDGELSSPFSTRPQLMTRSPALDSINGVPRPSTSNHGYASISPPRPPTPSSYSDHHTPFREVSNDF